MQEAVITRYTLGISSMFALYWLGQALLLRPMQQAGKLRAGQARLLGTALLYLPGLGLLWLLIRELPTTPITPAQFVAVTRLNPRFCVRSSTPLSEMKSCRE